jgi:VanZ family protein
MLIARIIAWLAALTVVMLTFVPPQFRLVTGAPHNIEHLLAFVLVGAAFGWAYPRWLFHIAVFGVAALGLMEFLQTEVPGRHGRLIDLVVNAIGFCAGIAAAQIFDAKLIRRAPPAK